MFYTNVSGSLNYRYFKLEANSTTLQLISFQEPSKLKQQTTEIENTTPSSISNQYESKIVKYPDDNTQQLISYCMVPNSTDQVNQYLKETNLPKDQALITIFRYSQEELLKIMQSSHGNYIFQELYEATVDTQDRQQILRAYDLAQLAENPSGTRCVQKIIQQSTGRLEEQQIIYEKFTDNFVQAIQSTNANHCIQRMIETFDDLTPLIQEYKYNFIEASESMFGCCIMQKLFEKCNELQFESFFQLTVANSQDLVQDVYGNYIIQYMLNCKKINQIQKDVLINSFLQLSVSLSCEKCSSHVVEKSLEISSKQVQDSIINVLIQNDQNIVKLCGDKYGNYVLQRVLKMSNDERKQKVKKVILTNKDQLYTNQYAKVIIAKLK